jgi:glucose-6-phosphate isomerase
MNTPRDNWPDYFRQLWMHRELGISLDPSRMQLPADLYERMRRPFGRAMAAMQALESGAVANPDEGRRVGHYWLRAPELAPDPETARAITDGAAAARQFAEDVLAGRVTAPDGSRFTDVLCIGIGGSALGPQLLFDALGDTPGSRGLPLYFIDNTDPAGIDRTLARLSDRLGSLLVVVTSKSGGTPETRNGMLEVASALEAAGEALAGHAVAITGADSQLDRQAEAEGWLARFPMHDWVGGRTSLFSVVGLLPAALAGVDTSALVEGAHAMDEATRAEAPEHNPAAILALAWYDAGDGGCGRRDMVVIPYKDALLLLARYLQQLVMESLGKGRDLDGGEVAQGIAVYGNKGSTDQHAYVQQLREGLDNFFVTFVEVLEGRPAEAASLQVEEDVTSADYLSGFLHGTRRALSDNGRRSLTITLPRVDARRLGALVALFERAVGFYASLVHVNAYHQPGVEAGKRAAAERLDLQRALLAVLRGSPDREFGLHDVAAAAGSDDVEGAYQTLRHLAANRSGVSLTGDPREPATLRARYTR